LKYLEEERRGEDNEKKERERERERIS